MPDRRTAWSRFGSPLRDPQRSVIDGQVTNLDVVDGGGRGCDSAQGRPGGDMSGVGEGAVLGQRTRLPSQLVTAKGDDHAVEVDADLDASADRPGVDRVVASIDADVMVPGDAGREPQRRIGQG